MECKKLINIETNTLISLYPKGMVLEVRQNFIQSYPMAREKFIVLYILCLSHPHMLSYNEIIDILKTANINLPKVANLKKLVAAIKTDLNSYNVKKLIIDIKGTGYAISNKWVEPDSIKERKDSRLLNYVRRMCGIAANMVQD